MDEHREYIVAGIDDRHVVLELGRIHLAAGAAQHLDDVVLQASKVHLDVVSKWHKIMEQRNIIKWSEHSEYTELTIPSGEI